MFNLFDILQSQSGSGAQTIGQQFGLSQEQSRRAIEALLPALAAGFQHSAASDPMGFGRMLGFAGTGATGNPYAFGTEPIFAQLFGSPALSQAVLQQAASASGIGTQTLRQMLPVMAGMVATGIVHVILNDSARLAQPQSPAPAPSPGFPIANYWSDWIDGVLEATKPSQEPKTEPKPTVPPVPDRSSDAAPPKSEGAPFALFQDLFQAGVQAQEQNVRAMNDIVGAFFTDPKTKEPPAADAPAVDEATVAKPRRASRKTTSKAEG